jgi:hypothetical protein
LVVTAAVFLACRTATAQYTTAIAFDDEHVYQGTPYGVVVRDRADPATILTRYTRHAPLVEALSFNRRGDPMAKVIGGQQVSSAEGRGEMLVLPAAGNDVLSENSVAGMSVDAKKRLWIASHDTGIVRREPDGRFFWVPSPIDSPILGLVSQGTDIWVAFDDSIARYDGSKWYGSDPGDQDIGRAPVADVTLTPTGDPVFALFGGGVGRVEKGVYRQQRLAGRRLRNLNWMTTVLIDRNGTVWGALERDEPIGLLRYRGRTGTVITRGLPDLRVTALGESEELGLLVGTERGLFTVRRRKGAYEVTPLANGLGDDLWVNVIAADGEITWVGTARGLVRLRAGERELFVEPSPRPLRPQDNVEMQCEESPILSHGQWNTTVYRVQRLRGTCMINVPTVYGQEFPPHPWRIDCARFDDLVARLQPERWNEMQPATTYVGDDFETHIGFKERDASGTWDWRGGSNAFRVARGTVQAAMCRGLRRLAEETKPPSETEPPEPEPVRDESPSTAAP